MAFPFSNYTKLEQWRKLTTDLARIKAEEMKLRKELFGEIFMNSEREGTHSFDLDGGWKLEAVVLYSRSLDQALAAEVFKKVKKSHPTLIKVKYDLSVAEYRKLDDATKAGIDAILTTKPGSPSMELVPPKI